MAANQIGLNQTFAIHNADGTPFHNLVMHKATVDSVVMSLGDKITGEVYYRDNTLTVTMQEYIVYKDVHYVLVNPPTIVREGMVSDNSGLSGMTKYSFEFYHPMCMLGNFPFTDVAVSYDQEKYLSESKTFSWIGTGFDLIAKLNKNLDGTQWVVVTSNDTESLAKLQKLSEVLAFDKQFISDVLKTGYEQWEVPFVIDSLHQGEYYDAHNVDYYTQGKRFVIVVGLPSNEIYTTDGNGNLTSTPFVFRFGQGVGLKNNSRTPKNNKIITRIVGYGSENNIPYGYPQIIWTGDQSWDYTINNDSTATGSYPIYDGIVGGQRVRLIKHPFTRNHLMPTIYVHTVNRKVNPYATGYNPDITIYDFYDANAPHYPNPIVRDAPSVEIHEFEDIKPQLLDAEIANVLPYDEKEAHYMTDAAFRAYMQAQIPLYDPMTQSRMREMMDAYDLGVDAERGFNGGSYTYEWVLDFDGQFCKVHYGSPTFIFDDNVLLQGSTPVIEWDDTMDDDGKYKQSYFKLVLPQLDFDLYACASITEEMNIVMRSGGCIGCTFPIQVDWDDYKKNFYNSDGVFDPVIGTGHPRSATKYPDSSTGSITVIVQKDINTFGTLMPNRYQMPATGDLFVITGISLPTSYITNAEERLDEAMQEYMLENNVYYYEYPLKFDEHFLATHTEILEQIRNNTIVRFQFADEVTDNILYVKQMTVKYGDKPLPQYDITLTDDVEIVLNQIGQVTDDVSRMRVEISELQKYYGENVAQLIAEKLSRTADDVAQGHITFQQGLDALGSIIAHAEIRSPQFESGLYTGRGWRVDELGNAEFESVRARSFLEVVELLVNRLQAQEGDTLFSDNDQIDKVEKIVENGTTSYVLSLKEKYQGYITPQMYGNVVKGIINTLAAKQAGVSTYTDAQTVEVDGSNTYYTSWMRVTGTHNTDNTLGTNQIRVVLYGDAQTPAGKNFEPCELMTIARWGCVDYSDPTDPDYETIKASITRRQRMFMISTTEGRVVKYTGVDAPILKNGNYGVTIGELPEFVKNYTDVRAILNQVGEHTDWLYAQGVVVGNYVKITREGLPVPTIVYCGDWVDGSQIQDPTPRNGIYFYNEYNNDAMQYETHQVSHKGVLWQCLQHQPVVVGGVATYYEPKWNSAYWKMVNGNDNLTIEFVSSKGYSFRRGAVNTDITPHLFYGNVDITSDVAAEYWNWTRESESGKTIQDETWDAQHQHMKEIHLSNLDMPSTWSTRDKAIFTCTVTLNDGKTTRIVDNQIIS